MGGGILDVKKDQRRRERKRQEFIDSLPLPEPSEGEEMICLCGSTRFKEIWERAFAYLLQEGWFVRGVECYGHQTGVLGISLEQVFPEGYKDYISELHKERIRESDAILVINGVKKVDDDYEPYLGEDEVWGDVTGTYAHYIGESTREEIELAKELGKNIYYLNGDEK